jgi:hypothetical protein
MEQGSAQDYTANSQLKHFGNCCLSRAFSTFSQCPDWEWHWRSELLFRVGDCLEGASSGRSVCVLAMEQLISDVCQECAWGPWDTSVMFAALSGYF